MGNWYTNVSLHGVAVTDVVAQLEELGRRAYVTPDVSGWITVYDEETDKFDLSVLESLALTLSTRLGCTALASCNADDDLLWLALYRHGALATRYASSRSAFEDGDEFPAVVDAAAVLAGVFDRPDAQKRAARVLAKSHGVLGLLSIVIRVRLAYLFEVQRHQDLTDLLAMPRAGVGFGYKYVDRGETPEGVNRAELRHTLAG